MRFSVIIHTDACKAMIQAVTGQYLEPRTFSDKDDIYSYECEREARESYIQRKTDVAVFETGVELGVKTYIVMPPSIFGIGRGLFNKLSIQAPTILRSAIKAGQAEVIGDGKAQWDHVHIADLVLLYELILSKLLKLAHGKQGIFFAETGHHT